MSNVVPFPVRLRTAWDATGGIQEAKAQAQADEIQALLSKVLDSCPACGGIGHFVHKHPVSGTIAHSPCPCGGTDEDRIDLNDFDFNGAA